MGLTLRIAVRVMLMSYIVLPAIGALRPIAELAQPSDDRYRASWIPPELVMIAKNVIFSAEISLGAAAVFLLCTLLFLKRETGVSLQRLVVLLVALFFVPPTLKAYAFHSVWSGLEHLGFPPKLLFFLWTLTFNSVFFWGALLAFVKTSNARSTIDALNETALPKDRFVWTLRLVLAPTLVAWVCCFAFTLFSGLELQLLVPNVSPIGYTINDLFAGSDIYAARMSLAAMLTGFSVVAFMSVATKYAWRQV